MKIEQLLVQHFYSKKEVTLQGLGTFTLSPHFVLPTDNNKDLLLPEGSITFSYNNRATEDEDLINYIVQQTRKMKSLASSDLDSYLVLGKQFLNIGKPFHLEGLGILFKNQIGEFQFTQGSTLLASKPEAGTSVLKEKRVEEEISFASESKHSNNGKKGLLIAAIIVGIGMVGAATWYFYFKNKPSTITPITVVDSTKLQPALTDSIQISKYPVADSYSFKVVFLETADTSLARARLNMWLGRGHKVIMYTKDSVKYKLAEPFTLPLSDTTRIKDSLNSFYFLGAGFIELN